MTQINKNHYIHDDGNSWCTEFIDGDSLTDDGDVMDCSKCFLIVFFGLERPVAECLKTTE